MSSSDPTAADASPVPDLCIPCYEHRHEDCPGLAWCDEEVGVSGCFCGNDWHGIDLEDPQLRAWWESEYPDGINCYRSDGPAEHWNRGAMRGTPDD